MRFAGVPVNVRLVAVPPTDTVDVLAAVTVPSRTPSVTVRLPESTSLKGVLVAGQTRFPFTSSVTVNDTGAETTGASSTGVIEIVLVAVLESVPVPLLSEILVVRTRDAVLLAAPVYVIRPGVPVKYAFSAATVPVNVRARPVPPTVTPFAVTAAIAPSATPSVTVIAVAGAESTSANGVPVNASTVAVSSVTVSDDGTATVGAVRGSTTSTMDTVNAFSVNRPP